MGFPSPPFDVIHDAVYDATSSGRYSTDGILCAKVWTELARSISTALDSEHLSALAVAERQLNQEADITEVEFWSEKLSRRMNNELVLDNRRTEAITRIIWCALDTKHGIDTDMGELIVEVAEEAEIPAAALVEILEGSLPAFRTPLRKV